MASEISTRCRICDHRRPTDIFELCGHASAKYRDNMGNDQQHTVGHMRRYECGPQAVHFVAGVPNGK